MSQIVQSGQINTTALVVPDLYVQILPPSVVLLNGVPTNVIGAVGTASWGPVNAPTTLGSMADYSRLFGPIINRKYDLGTGLAAAVLQGANNFRGVRVTDGTDTAASVIVQASCITFTAKYSGSLGNTIQITIGTGSKTGTSRATVALPGQPAEVFDNLAGTGAALWAAMAAAVNQGQSGLRGPSGVVVASAGAGTATPTIATYPLAGGTDGASTVNGLTMLGQDTGTRTGMYALRGTGSSVGFLVDCDDSTTWSDQEAYSLSEGTYMIGVGPAGDTIDNAVAAKASAGIDSYGFKLLLGDWCYWNDTVNGVTRLISPQGFVAGLLGNLSPQNSGLNKKLFGIVGTQRSLQNLTYSTAELTQLGQASIDVIANPIPAGAMFGLRFGHNSSSNAAIYGDNYTRMTNYEASTIGAGMGLYVGQLQSNQPNDPWRRGVKATLDAFLQAQKDATPPMIDDFQTQCDQNNNPPSQVAQGVGQALVQITYLSVVEKFLVNVQGGQTVQITRLSTTPVAS